MNCAAVIFALITTWSSHGAQKPPCNAANQGRFWPEEANINRDAARRLSQSGELETCALAVWKYKWKRLSVNARNAVNAKKIAAQHRNTEPRP